MAKNPTTPIPLSATKHADKRTNIPTEELKDFLPEDAQRPTPIRYPRDPSLDPQLVWKGKDEQDDADLEVPAVPIYIQEKVHPQALIEDLRAHSKDDTDQTLSLFSDFNGIKFEDMVDFYHHEQNWSNRMILGDSLLVMNSLAEKEGLKGKVQMIYIDPPYGIKFGSNWQVSTRKRDVKDGKAEDATRQPEQIKAFRDTWELGIHSYLAYLRDRLTVARELLTESGSVFVQIGDENVHLVRCLMDEVFGAENYVSQIDFATSGGRASAQLPATSNYVLWYSKDKEGIKFRRLFRSKERGGTGSGEFSWVSLPNDEVRRMTADENADLRLLPEGSQVCIPDNLTSSHDYIRDPFEYRGHAYTPGKRFWSTSLEGTERLARSDRLVVQGSTLRYKRLFIDFPYREFDDTWTDTAARGFFEEKVYVVQTGVRVIERCMLMTTDPGDLVLDPTCGSGTTAYVAEQWGRRWITCDTSRVALALTRTRLMAARHPYYLLADSPEGVKKEAEVTGIIPPDYATAGDIRKGFVYKRVPHVTLKSIANNAEIDAIHERYQPQLETLLAKMNKAAGKAWKEWEVPRVAPSVPNPQPPALSPLLSEWWTLRGKRQAEIDASIARRADTEVLYDQPYEDGKRVRVSGPFTVESLSPHRQLSVSTKVALGDGASDVAPGLAVRALGPDQFGTMILDHLKKAGVQNTVKGQRLKFTRLEPFAGEWIHAAGEYLEGETSKRVAVCIGPEYGTVGAELVHHAAVEAVQGVGFDLLLVCGFAFDPGAYEEVKRYGKLTVLMSRMNPDLAMGEDLLKKTGAANLFVVFGEPDISVTSGQWLVTRNGRLIANYDHVKELSGLGSLDEINRVGRTGLQRIGQVPGRGTIRADKSDPAGGGIGGGEHSGGSRAGRDAGVPPVPGDRDGFVGGNGDIHGSGGAVGPSNAGGNRPGSGAGRGGWQDAQRPQALAALQGLNDVDFPLSLTTSYRTQITIHGLDVYDPTTGEVRSHTTDDIACWFVDTDYNGQSFFVRHAYFTGAGDPYEKLRKTLKAEVDEAAWSSLYATISRPFDPPKTGKIAVKVINHYGDEVLKVYEVK